MCLKVLRSRSRKRLTGTKTTPEPCKRKCWTKLKGFVSSLFGSCRTKQKKAAALTETSLEETSLGNIDGNITRSCAATREPLTFDTISLPKGPQSATSVVSLQKASWSWDLTDELVSLCDTSWDDLITKCPKEIEADAAGGKLLWATALALVLLMGRWTDKKNEWEMIAEKGKKWPKKNLPSTIIVAKILETAAVTVGVWNEVGSLNALRRTLVVCCYTMKLLAWVFLHVSTLLVV